MPVHEIHPLPPSFKQGEIVQLDCDTQCNFMLLTDTEYEAYQRVASFRYHRGTFKTFPAHITVPVTGDWNIVIDQAGVPGEIQYTVTVVFDPAKGSRSVEAAG